MAKFEKGKIFVANDLVDYAEGGVVSKELVHSNAGSVTLFSFDEGQGLSEHLAPFDATLKARTIASKPARASSFPAGHVTA